MDAIPESLIGNEFGWLSQDGAGHLAAFCTAGWGPVPVSILLHLDEERALLDPVLEFEEWAAPGFYVYDWKGHTGPYLRVHVPNPPLLVVDAPPEVRRLSGIARLDLADFSRDKRLRVQEHIHCAV